MKRDAWTPPLSLAPPPSWLVELARRELGFVVERATARRVSGALLVRLAGGPRTEVVELRDAHPADLSRFDFTGGSPRRIPLPMDDGERAAARRFHRRARSLFTNGATHDLTRREQALARLALELASVRAPEDAARITVGDAAAMRAFALYVALLQGDFGPVLDTIDSGDLDALPAWLSLVLVGLGGSPAELRIRAGAPPSEGVLVLVEGAALQDAGLTEAALGRYRHAASTLFGPFSAIALLGIARLERERRQLSEAVVYARRAALSPISEHMLARAVEELVKCGAYEDAHAVLRAHVRPETVAAGSTPLALALAELLLWAGRPAEAREVLDQIPRGLPDLRLDRARGIERALAGCPEDAVAALEATRRRHPDDMETLLWLGELNLRLGRREEASRHATESRIRVGTPAHVLLVAALEDVPTAQPELTHLLEALGEDVAPWLVDPAAAALRVLARFGGNRSEHLTLRDPSAPSLGLKRLVVPSEDSVLSSRDASADLLRAIGAVPLDELEQRFAELTERYPQSPHPFCYWGELALWRGELDLAIERFDRALARATARWGHVGRAAAQILLGRWADAEASLAQLAYSFAPVRGATTHVYVGEMWRKRGDMRLAIAELSEAVDAKPGRIGARINLALAHLELDDVAAADAIREHLEARVPRLLWDAQRALGAAPTWPPPRERTEAIYLKSLELMRGNRSSHTITYFDHEGTFRIERPMPAWRSRLASQALTISVGLRDRIASELET